jgi:hypothetical protein
MPSPVKFPGLSKVDQDRVEQVGIDLGMTNRCGSYLQMDQDIVQSECSQQGIEVLSFKKAMEKYDGMKEYTWQAVSPEKDDITRYVAAQKEPKGYVIIAHKGSNNILPIQACLYLGREVSSLPKKVPSSTSYQGARAGPMSGKAELTMVSQNFL